MTARFEWAVGGKPAISFERPERRYQAHELRAMAAVLDVVGECYSQEWGPPMHIDSRLDLDRVLGGVFG